MVLVKSRCSSIPIYTRSTALNDASCVAAGSWDSYGSFTTHGTTAELAMLAMFSATHSHPMHSPSHDQGIQFWPISIWRSMHIMIRMWWDWIFVTFCNSICHSDSIWQLTESLVPVGKSNWAHRKQAIPQDLYHQSNQSLRCLLYWTEMGMLKRDTPKCPFRHSEKTIGQIIMNHEILQYPLRQPQMVAEEEILRSRHVHHITVVKWRAHIHPHFYS
jgi:hypothetical protein